MVILVPSCLRKATVYGSMFTLRVDFVYHIVSARTLQIGSLISSLCWPRASSLINYVVEIS